MTSVKNWMVGLAAGAAAMGSVSAVADSPKLSIDKQSQTVQTPTSAASGMTYQATGAQTSTLTVYTEGYLLCGNIGSDQTPVKLELAHEDQSSQQARRWALPSALARSFSYASGGLVINPGDSLSSLVCHSLGVDGSVASGLREGIFDNGYDSATVSNYKSLVNWIPSAGFDWNSPDWAEVPQDPCGWSTYDEARAKEDVACAAVTGISAASVRAPTMLTGVTHGVVFTYVFRVDARFGAPPAGQNGVLRTPLLNALADPDATPTSMQVLVQDAYDSTYLSASGSYCTFATLPGTIDNNICNAAGVTAAPLPASGLLNIPFAVGQQLPSPVSQSFYVAVNRTIAGAPQLNGGTPIVVASILVDPVVSAEGADDFRGDNAVFGFMPSSSGFPWMGGNP